MPAQDQLGVWKSEAGFAFRVWAPNASDVSVVGDFNGWDWSKNAMAKDHHGCWFADVPEAQFGHEYRFEISNGSERFVRVDPYAKAVVNSVGNGIISDLRFDWGDDKYSLPPRNELIIYEMHIGTFHAKQAGTPATFDDAIEKLDHLADLGINVVEIMPCAEFAGDLSWEYNPAHPFAVEEVYGGPVGLKRFVRACHLRGIGVILDVVYNHFGPSDLSLWRFDGWSENGKGRVTTEVNASNPTGWHAKKRSALATAIAITSPGVPMLFQGQEMLEDEWFRDTDPIDWSLATEFAGVVKMYRDLIRLRRNIEGLSKGLTGSGFGVLCQNEEQRIVAMHRWFNGGISDDVVVVINLSTNSFDAVEIPLPRAGSWQLRFNSDWKGYSEDFGDYASSPKMEVTSDGQVQPFQLASYSVQILVLCS